MITIMENLGEKKVQATLPWLPPGLFSLRRTRSARRTGPTPPFEPYEEHLPLQSGYYSFVIDSLGQFHVIWGNTSSHGAMVDYQQVAAAGNFRISRIGKLAEVKFTSYDYKVYYRGQHDRMLAYAIEAFVRHPAFDASEYVIFEFSKQWLKNVSVNRRAEILSLDEIQRHRELLESEGLGDEVRIKLDRTRIQLFNNYQPSPPPRVHAMHLDQLIISIENEDSVPEFHPGPTHPRYSTESPGLRAGKNNFVIDKAGWLIIGVNGHHFLSGGLEVGGAGHLIVGESGKISAIHLNFSGHYRPPLTFDYVRYVFRTLINHPLLSVEEECDVRGRKFDEQADKTTVIRFARQELLSDDPEGEEALERVLL